MVNFSIYKTYSKILTTKFFTFIIFLYFFNIFINNIGKSYVFFKYNDEEYNTPLCYNCPDTSDLNCCANIKESQDRNGAGIKNDYVFENDIDDRKKNNLNTIISLLDYRSI